MEGNIDFNQIWKRQEIETPNVKYLYSQVDKLKKKSLLKLIVVNFLMFITMIFIGFIWYYYQPEFIATKLGIIIVILAMVIFLASYNTQWKLLTKNQNEPNSKQYLEQLLKLKEKQLYQQKTILSAYFIMLFLGVGLYLFEYVSKMSIVWAIVAYSLVLIWSLVNWFYLRPITIKKQNAKLNEIIIEFKKLYNQIND